MTDLQKFTIATAIILTSTNTFLNQQMSRAQLRSIPRVRSLAATTAGLLRLFGVLVVERDAVALGQGRGGSVSGLRHRLAAHETVNFWQQEENNEV